MLRVLHELEEAAKVQESIKEEAARVQTGMYWLKNGDAPNKVFFKALRTKKDFEHVSALKKPDGSETTDEEEIRTLFTDSLSSIVGSPLDTSGEF